MAKKKTEATETEANVPWGREQAARLDKWARGLVRAGNAMERAGRKDDGSIQSAVNALGKAAKAFLALPDSFAPSIVGGQRIEFAKGQTVRVADDYRPLYTVHDGLVVTEVIRIGGQEGTGRGSKIFVRCKSGSMVLTYPANHLTM